MKGKIVRYARNYYFSKIVDVVDNESTYHYHQTYEIYYMQCGSCNYIIDNYSYKVKQGDVVLIPGGAIHCTNYKGVSHTRQLINCSYEYVPASIVERLSGIGHIYRNSKVKTQLEEIFSKIEYEYAHSDDLSEEMLKCYTSELLLLILRNKNEIEIVQDESNLITNVLEYIQHNYMNEIKLSYVAKQFSVSQEHLSRLFKHETGFGFKNYLTNIRLQKAEDMLRNEPGRAVSEVAYACGFNDGNYFSYKFKKEFGVSPTEVKGRKREII